MSVTVTDDVDKPRYIKGLELRSPIRICSALGGPHKGRWCYVRQVIWRPMWYQFLDVACALNFDLHSSVREYSHRVKRIARAGRGGSALLLMLLPLKFC
jgi:hypothetical protein